MARIAGVDLPRDKRIEVGLTYVYGIGPNKAKEIIAATGVNPDIRVKDLTEEDAGKLREYIAANFKGVTFSRPQGTYMLFIDCKEWLREHGKTMDDVLKACHDVGVAIQDGRAFHGRTHLRMNLALPLSRVQEAFRRVDTYVFNA